MTRFSSILLIALFVIFFSVALIQANEEGFRDEKDIARLTTCVGPCLSKFPGAKDFIMKYSFYISGLQTMFTGGDPKLTVYDDDESVKDEIDLSDKSAEEILKLVKDAGCKYTGDN